LRLTFIMAGADLTGGNRVIATYAERLARRGHTVTVVSRPRRPARFRSRIKAWLRGRPLPRYVPWGPSHLDNLVGVEHRRIKRFRPITANDVPDADVVIATWWETAEWVASYPHSKGRKAYFVQHYEAHPGQDAARVDATWRLPLHKIIIANWLAELSRDKFGDADFSMAPNAVDHDLFHAPPRGKRPVPTVGTMYSIDSYKAAEIAIRAFELARERVPELRLVSFGNCPPIESIPLPAGTDYAVRPPQEQLRDRYAACDVWLVSSRSEGFGLPILEAMACRTPVIATPTGAAPELMGQGGGVLVGYDDPRAMADEIVRVVGLPEADWRALSDAAHATAQGNNWDRATEVFEAALARAR
jgi:glycosyltransferase involved in cell wall biosynthesis